MDNMWLAGADRTASRVHPSSYSNTVELEGFYHVHTDSGELQETSATPGGNLHGSSKTGQSVNLSTRSTAVQSHSKQGSMF